jgi:hypothetical protein
MKQRITKRTIEAKKATSQRQRQIGSLSKDELPSNFDPVGYLELNPDVASHPNYGTVEGAKLHWLRHGRHEKSACC